jgi:adenylate kinase
VAEGTALGLEVKRIMAEGGYISDDITNAIVADRLAQADVEPGFLLDGYPRTLGQVDALDEVLTTHGHSLDAVISLEADIDEVVRRLHRRAQTQGREDDSEEAIRKRQHVYASETSPLLDVYRSRGLLVSVNGLGTEEDVSARLFAALDAHTA